MEDKILHRLRFLIYVCLFYCGANAVAIARADQAGDLPITVPGVLLVAVNEAVNTQTENSAARSDFFSPYQERIIQELSGGISFRLPDNLYLYSFPNDGQEQAEVSIIHQLGFPGLRAGFQICRPSESELIGADQGQCINGIFSAISLDSQEAQKTFEAHQAVGYPFTLTSGIQGYYKEYERESATYASIMWEQDAQFYQVEFPIYERQSLLYMAHEMATGTALVPQATASRLPRESLGSPSGILQIQEPHSLVTTPSLASAVVADVTLTNEAATSITIESLDFVGNTLFSNDEILDLLRTRQADEDAATLDDMATWITEEYINRGYITSSAVPRNDNTGIDFIEGYLDEINISSTEESSTLTLEDYVRVRIDQVAGRPLNFDRLEEGLRLLRLDPLFDNIEATLSAVDVEDGNRRPGASQLTIRVDEADPVNYGVSINNDAATSLGGEQGEVGFSHLNVVGWGDRFSANYSRSFEGGLSHIAAAYQVPISPMNGTLSFSGDVISTAVVEAPFDDLNIEGNTYRYAVWVRQPLIRKPQEEFGLALGFTYTSGQTFFLDRLPTPFGFGPDEDGFSRTSVLSFTQDYAYREPNGAWVARSQFNLGLPLFSATRNDTPVPDGEFFSWQGLLQRVQRLGNDHLLIAQVDMQLTPNSLLPSESFSVGGRNSVRGYRAGARSGDNGLHFYLEDRFTVKRDGAGRPVITLRPFFDVGTVWNHPNNPNTITGPTWLVGTGLGITVENLTGFEGLSFRADYGVPLIHLDDVGNDLQDHGFYFGINYNSDRN